MPEPEIRKTLNPKDIKTCFPGRTRAATNYEILNAFQDARLEPHPLWHSHGHAEEPAPTANLWAGRLSIRAATGDFYIIIQERQKAFYWTYGFDRGSQHSRNSLLQGPFNKDPIIFRPYPGVFFLTLQNICWICPGLEVNLQPCAFSLRHDRGSFTISMIAN